MNARVLLAAVLGAAAGAGRSDDLGRLREEYAGTASDMVDHVFWRALQFLIAAIVLIVGGVFLSRHLKTARNAEQT